MATFDLLHQLLFIFMLLSCVSNVACTVVVFFSSFLWLTGVSGGCCQTISEIDDNPVVMAASGLSHAVLE